MADTVAEIAPWAEVGAEVWIWHRMHRSTDDWAEHATVIRVAKTRVTVTVGGSTRQAFKPGRAGRERSTLLEHPRKDTWAPDDELLAPDDPRLPGIIDAQLKRARTLSAKYACDDYRKSPSIEAAQNAIAKLTAYIEIHQGQDADSPHT